MELRIRRSINHLQACGMLAPALVLLVILLVGSSAALPSGATARTATTVSGQEVYNSLPEEEREPFLAYELALGLEKVAENKASVLVQPQPRVLEGSESLAERLHSEYGIPEHLVRKFQTLPAPHDFDLKMYSWVRQTADPTFAQMMELAARGRYCIGGVCFTLQEPFGNCCPF